MASPNEGTPLATPERWEDTVGWIANLLELFPDNPFTTGAEFVANGLVWIARHASGDLPGLHSMDGDGDLIEALQSPPGPPSESYSALVSNYNPTGNVLEVMLDVGRRSVLRVRQRSGGAVGGRLADRSVGRLVHSRLADRLFRSGRQPGAAAVTHVNFFSQPETSRFLVNALTGKRAVARAGRSGEGASRQAAAAIGRAEGALPPVRDGPCDARRLDDGIVRPRPIDRAAPPDTLARHRRQRRSHVRATAVAARALSRHAADRHREDHEHADRRRDEARARSWRLRACCPARTGCS